MINFKKQANNTLKAGYPIVPISAGTKAPLIKEWQKRDFGINDINAGVGVKCGQGVNPICAVDLDVTDAKMVDQLTQWCSTNIGVTVERVGNAPKTLLVYRAAEANWRKAKSVIYAGEDGKDQAVEILGDGQQFVAYHVHPTTNKPYEWVDFLGGIESVHASDLPTITEKQISDLLDYFDTLAAAKNLSVKVNSPRANVTPTRTNANDSDDFMAGMPVGVDLAESQALLNNVTNYDYDNFIAMGMALHAEYKGSEAAYSVWLEWASRSDNFKDASFLENHWRNFKENSNGVTLRSLLKVGYEAKEVVEKEVKVNAITEYKNAISACKDAFELEAALKKIGTTLDTSEVITYSEVKNSAKNAFKSLVGTTLTNANLDKMLNAGGGRKKQNADEPDEIALTEFGNATRMLEKFGKDIMFAADTETWYRWKNNYWQVSSATEMEHLAKRTLDEWIADADVDSNDEDTYNFMKASQTLRMMTSMVKIVRTEPKTMVMTENLDLNLDVLTCTNGSVNLQTGELIAPNRADLATLSTLIDYDPTATCPIFEQTVSEVFFGDAELIAFFKRLMGYTLLAKPTDSLLVIPYGQGSNGKSTVLGAIKDALGLHGVMSASEMFTSTGGFTSSGGPRDDIIRLRGRRFIYTSELDEDRDLKEGLVKSMTGGEAMSARSAYSRKFVEFKPTWTVVMPTNHKPNIKGDDFAIWRRVMLIPFTRNFSTDPAIVKDTGRAAKLEKELQGILNWLVAGAIEYQAVGVNPPASIELARENYKKDMDLLAEWIEDCCIITPDGVAPNQALWASWERFADARGELRFISNARTLNRKLAGRGDIKAVKNVKGMRGRGMQGIMIKPQDFDDEAIVFDNLDS